MVGTQAALAAVAGRGAQPAVYGGLLFLFAAGGSFALLLYAQANTLFPLRLTGRVVTAINLFMFLGGFALQWGIGVVIEWLSPTGGGAATGAYTAALLVSAALCALALLAYLPTLAATRTATTES